jgi:hypothetical protein
MKRTPKLLTMLCALLTLSTIATHADRGALEAEDGRPLSITGAPSEGTQSPLASPDPPSGPPEGRPKFKGLVLQQDPQRRYSFWSPKGWHCGPLDDGGEGVLCSPMAEDRDTFFSVQVTPLTTTFSPTAASALRTGLQSGLAQLPGLEVESQAESIAEGRITLERVYTYREGDRVRKRRARWIYDGDKLYALLSQGSTVEEYEYWLSMLNYSQGTFSTSPFCMACFDTE